MTDNSAWIWHKWRYYGRAGAASGPDQVTDGQQEEELLKGIRRGAD